MNIKEDDIVLCTVKRIEGTTVFLDIENNGVGSMIFSEVSPGRIRNIREFVVPNKKIVCKVLRIRHNQIELSLRRVTGKEREEVMESYKKESILKNILHAVLGDKTDKIISKIKTSYNLADFLDSIRESPKVAEEFLSKKESESLEKILSEKKEKEKDVKQKITLRSESESGIYDIKEILNINKTEISYLGSSKFSIGVKAKSYKEANVRIEEIIEEIKKRAKKLHAHIETKIK